MYSTRQLKTKRERGSCDGSKWRLMKSVIQEERSCLGNSQEESTEPISSFTIATPFSIHYSWKEQ